MYHLSKSLEKAFPLGWPHWPGTQFTISLTDQIGGEAATLGLDPVLIIGRAHRASQRGVPFAEIWGELERSLTVLVYGSNFIETAGSSFQITAQLCQDVFRGNPVSIDIDEGDPSYQQHLETLTKTGRKADKANVIRSRREVVHHAKALSFMIDRVVLNSEPWSERLILQTQTMLYDGLDDEITPGQYRDHEVGVSYSKPGEKKKRSICMRAAAVPRYMKQLIVELNNEIAHAETVGHIDPYTLAARYHHHFVMIHPFADGNGRMTRIILNVLLLKYAGHVAHIGSENEKEDYLNVVTRGSKVFQQEDMEVEFSEQTSHRETARFILAKSKSPLEQMWTWAGAK